MSTLKEYRCCKKGFLWILILLIPAVAMVNTASASPITVFVNPPTIIDPGMVPGTQFSIDITVDYVNKLLAYQFLMFFNPSVLHGVSVAPGPFLASAGGSPIFYPGVGFDNDAGVLYLVAEALRPPPATPPNRIPSGGGVLATVTFEVVGYGTSPLTLGPETGLINIAGGWQFGDEWCYGWYPEEEYPGGPIIWVPYQPWRDSLGHGFFNNEAPPEVELYIRRGGSGGGPGAWPEWSAGNVGDEQILYSHVSNKGPMGAWVFVKFTVTHSMLPTQEFETDVMWVDPDPDNRITASTDPFTPTTPGYYKVYAELWFKAGSMPDFAAYTEVEEGLGGFGDTKSEGTAVKFKVT